MSDLRGDLQSKHTIRLYNTRTLYAQLFRLTRV
jgi:hypothetical protein